MRELKIDPVTLDFLRDGRGGLVYADGAETAVLHQLSIEFGGDWLLPTDGSRLHELSLFGGANSPEAIDAEIRRCLDVLVRRGRISEPQVVARQVRTGRVDAEVRYRDTRTGRPISFSTTSEE